MKYSLMTEPQLGGSYQDLLDFALHAEKLGLESFARSDHLAWTGRPRAATDPFATIAGLARDTETIRLCVLVTPVTLRHPAVIAKNAATIDQMSGGRLDLGVGTGWNRPEHEMLGVAFPDPTERWARFEDALGYLRAAFADPSPRYDGDYYSLATNMLPKPAGIRLIIGGSGPKRTPRLAGEQADEYNTYADEPDDVRSRIAVMRSAAGERQVEVTVMTELQPHAIERLHDRISGLEEVGVERIYLQWLDLDDFDGMARSVEALMAR